MDSNNIARLGRPADLMKRVDVPEIASKKRRLRLPKVVGRGIAHDAALAHEIAADRLAGLDESRIVRLDSSPSSATSSTLASRSGDPNAPVKRASLLVPTVLQNAFAQLVGAWPRQYFARSAILSRAGNPAEPVAGRPAKCRRIGVRARSAPIFPQARIGLEGHRMAIARRGSPRSERATRRPSSAAARRRTSASPLAPRCHKRRSALARRLIADANRAHSPRKPLRSGAMRSSSGENGTMP